MNNCFAEIIKSIDLIIEISGEKLEGNCYYPQDKTNINSVILESLSNKRKNYRKTVSNKKHVCEIGFNAGHSLICMLLENPDAEFTIFDLGEHKYSRPCFDFCKQLFHNTKIEIFWGDSRETLSNYLESPLHKTFDVIHIDGGHTPEVFEKDWNYSYKLVKENGIIIFDDTDLPNIKNFVNNQIKKKLVLDDSHNYELTQILEHKILIKMNQEQNIKQVKPKLLWVGDDYRIKSGYGRVARELFPYLFRKYDIIQYSIGCQGVSNEYYVIDSNDGTSFGFNKLPNVINIIEPTVVILLNDSKIIHGWLSCIKQNCKNIPLLIPYVCTEYIGVPENEVDLYNSICSGLLAMANFTIDEFNNNGSILKSMRLSHGYSDNIKKINKIDAKHKLNIPADTFVFFSGSKNQPRKRLDIIIRAFVDLLTKHADKKILLMLNCGLIDSGWNLKELYIRLCKENKIANMERYIYFCSNNINDSNKNDDELTVIYNACDVGITTSTGESFGLIPFEQSALGIPQIIPNWGGIIESVRYGSIKVDTNDYYVYPVVLQSCSGEARTVYYKDVSKEMETYLLDKELYELHSKEVLKNIEHYNWENIYVQLDHFLNQIFENKHSILIKEVKLRNDVSFKMTLYNDNDFISSWIDKYGIWEENNTNFILDLMKDNQNTEAIIIDIGANIGYYSLLSAAMGYTCYSFEPDPSNFEKLNSSIKLNNFDNKIKLYKNALSNKANETIILSTVGGTLVNHGCLTVLKDFISTSSNTVQCVTLKLDDVINKKDEILLIKIDVEGFEPEVIEGSLELIKSGNIKHILIEISPKFRKIEDYIKMICMLAQNNYRKIINLDSRKILNYEELIKELPNLPSGQCDYLFFYEKHETNNKIPKKIWQTWHTKDISVGMKENIEILKTQHSDFEYNLYDIEDCRDFIGKHFPEEILDTYDNLIPYAYKTDLFRCCILYIYGGIYMDIKYQLCNSFDLNYLIDREHFVLDRPGYALPGNITIQNGFIIAKAGNPILLDSINEIVQNVKNNYYGYNCLSPTGPGLLGIMYRKYKTSLNEFMMYFNIEGTIIFYNKLPILKFYDTYYTKDNTINNTKALTYWTLYALKQIYKQHLNKLDIPIWCINLEKNTNRKQHMIDEFHKQNMNFDFIHAVDGCKIDFLSPEYKSMFTDFGFNKIYSDIKTHGHDLTLGGAGLILTCKDVWNKITVPTLIFEDDVELCENFNLHLLNIITQLPNNWDIVYIGYYHDPRGQQIKEHIWTANKVYGLYGYLIHPNYAKKILNNVFPCNYQIDTEINRFNANSNCFVVYPPLVSRSNKFTTDIQIFDNHEIITDK